MTLMSLMSRRENQQRLRATMLRETAQQLAQLRYDLATWPRRLRQLGGGVDERAATERRATTIGRDELVLGAEVGIQGRLGRAGLRNDRVHTDGVDAMCVEQVTRHAENTLARRGGHITISRHRGPEVSVLQTGLSFTIASCRKLA